MIFLSKFIYDLSGRPKPTDQECDDEIDRLLYIKSAEQPDYLVDYDARDQLNNLDSEVLCSWLHRRFQPALILLLLEFENNYQLAKNELCKMERYQTIIDKFFRANFVYLHAMKRVRELCFDNQQSLDFEKSIAGLKKALVFLSDHLERSSPNQGTLLGTEAYAPADIVLYNYLKRLVCGKYKDNGLKNHIRLSDPLKRFMSRYASKNRYVLDVSAGDPLEDSTEQQNLPSDLIKPAIFATGLMLFFLWCKSRN